MIGSVMLLLGLVTPETAPQEPLESVAAVFAGFDHDGDGQAEIRRLTMLDGAGEAGPLVLGLVEERLLEPLEGAEDLRPLLARWAEDLASEGRRAQTVAVELEPSSVHQDGRYLLALREFLCRVDASHELDAVVLIGRFPDAYVVRTCNWRKKGKLVLHRDTEHERRYEEVRYLRRVPEGVAHRCDLVLADLDGHWEDVYVQPRTRLPSVRASFPGGVPEHGGLCEDLERGGRVFEDFFHVSDGKLETGEVLDADGSVAGTRVALFDASGDHECSSADRMLPNVIARPELVISRLDARGVALAPREDVEGVDGRGLLDDSGRPQELRFADGDRPEWRRLWSADPVLERRLLGEYFDRNHAYRSGKAELARRPASIAHGLASGYATMRRASADWEEDPTPLEDLKGRPSLTEFVEWLRYPALLRTVRAHSDPWGSAFGRPDPAELAERLGGPAWAWSPRGDCLVPSLDAACRGGKADWYLLQTLWRNRAVASEPAFYHHTGCEGISPPGARTRRFDHPAYGLRQGGESLLLFANGLALIGRAKVFYDEPRGFAEALREGASFGQAWRRYFEIESGATPWRKAGGNIGRKRSYFWSVLGDATLRLQ